MTGFIDDNGNYLDYSGADLAITSQVASFYDSKLKGDYTVDFKIPNTAKNRDTLGYYGPQQIVSPAFSQQPFSMVRNGNVLKKGYLIIKGSDQTNIDCFFVAGNSNWFDALQFNVRDIVFPSRFTVSWEDFYNQRSATEGIIFPVVDWCYDGWRRSRAFNLSNYSLDSAGNPNGAFEPIQEVFPCLYMHTLIQEMCTYGGINLSGNLISDPLYKKIIITPDGPVMSISESLIKKTAVRVGMSADEVTPSTYPIDTILEIGELANYNTATRSYTCPMKGVYKVSVSYSVKTITVQTTVQQHRGATLINSATYFTSGLQTFGAYEAQFSCEAGDLLSLRDTGGGLLAKDTTVYYGLENASKPYYLYNAGAGSYVLSCTGVVLPNAICPDITGVDLIKSICVMFGAYCTFDEASRTLSLNKISKLKREDAKDWSKYYISHYNNYQTGVATNNFFTYTDTPEVGKLPYTHNNAPGYGGRNLVTSYDQVAYRDVFKIPFAGSWDAPSKSMLNWFMPYIKFYDLTDDKDKTWLFNTVASSGGFAQFTSVATDQPFSAGDLVRITGSFYSGYGIVASKSTTTLTINYIDYIATDTGTITKVNFSPVQSTNRLLIAYPGGSTTDTGATGLAFYYGSTLGSSQTSTTGCLAWFDKPRINKNIDTQFDSLALDTISNRSYNNTLAERYHQFLDVIYKNPTVKAKLLLPAGVFQAFEFGSFIYLKTEDLTGTFFVQKIEWKDSVSECNVDLLYVD